MAAATNPVMTASPDVAAAITANASAQAPQSAAQRVFEIAELLEDILLKLFEGDLSNVPHQTVLLGQRINKFFNATINGSEAILQKLWMIPGCLPLDLVGSIERLPSQNTLILSNMAGLPFRSWVPGRRILTFGFEGPLEECEHTCILALDSAKDKSGSWRRMVFLPRGKVKQIIEFEVYQTLNEMENPFGVSKGTRMVVLEDCGGWTAGELVDKAVESLGEQ